MEESAVDFISDVNGDHGKKKMKKDNSKYKVIPKGPKKGDGGQSAIRKKIRDTERLLKRKDLPADVKVDLERRVKALSLELSGKANVKVEVKMHQKYKYIKHVESKKVMRRINQLEKRLKEMEEEVEEVDGNERDKTTRELEKYRVQLAYIHFFPRDMKYVSLFPKTSSTAEEEDNEEDQVQDSDMSKRIRQAVLTRIELAKSSGELKYSKFSLRLADVFEGAERRKIEAAQSLKKKETAPAAVTAATASSSSKSTGKKDQRSDGKVVKPQGRKGDTNTDLGKKSRNASLLSKKEVTRDNAKKRTSHEMEDDDDDDVEVEVEVEIDGEEDEEVAEDEDIQGDEEEEDAAGDDFFMSGDDGEQVADPKDLKFEDYVVEAPPSKSRASSSTNTFKKRKLDKGMGGADGIAEALAPLQSIRRSRGGSNQKKKQKIY